jgi:cytochrome c553
MLKVRGAFAAIAMIGVASAQNGFILHSVSVKLPTGRLSFPPGPNVTAVNTNCLICHSAGMVVNQPALPRATWGAEVHKMIADYKAPVQAADIPKIVDYLAATKGVNAASSTSPKQGGRP